MPIGVTWRLTRSVQNSARSLGSTLSVVMEIMVSLSVEASVAHRRAGEHMNLLVCPQKSSLAEATLATNRANGEL